MQIQFSKMHGLGNDFMVIDAITQQINLSQDLIRLWSDRNKGVGFDQLLVVEPPSSPEIDFRYRIFNADGGEVQQCGNGARCFARFVHDKKLTTKPEMRVETCSGVITLIIQGDDNVMVNMGSPILEPSEIPFLATSQEISYEVEVPNHNKQILSAISMGNPHGVLVVEDIQQCDIENLGPALEQHALFPEKANIGFMEIFDTNEIRLRVYERGVGETQACGTGACAAVVAGQLRGLLNRTSPVKVHLPGGDLSIQWQSHHPHEVIMTGSATLVYEGKIDI